MDRIKIYADVTDILKTKYTDDMRGNVFRIPESILGSDDDTVLLYYSEKSAAYHTVSAENFLSCLRDERSISDVISEETVRPDELERNSFFADLCSAGNSFPQRDWLLPELVNRDIHIISAADTRLLTSPESMSGAEKMRAMYCLTAQLRCSEKILVSSEEEAEALDGLRRAAGISGKLTAVYDDDMRIRTVGSHELTELFGADSAKDIPSFIRLSEKTEFEHRPLKQIVYLSARPEPLLRTLPYVVHYMPFIKEIVVCCPDRMADYLAKHYDLDAKLTVITDSQLLDGRKLPEDHSTRNFFLRCLAMQRDELDDEFIMSDDDYRPLETLSEEVFFSEGKYNSFYFIDLKNWIHTVAGIFSYDRCMFRTLEFLKKNGYPTYSFSAHQPQVINKTWYRRMLSEHPDISETGLDEWSTYFNYSAVHYRDHIRRVPYVVLGWPNVGTVWKHGVRIQKYIFENFYEENYRRGGVFYGMSPVFGSNTDSENCRKTEMAEGITAKLEEGYRIFDEYSEKYVTEHHALPVFSVYCSRDLPERISINAPESYVMKAGVLNELRFFISRSADSLGNSNSVVICASVHDSGGKEYFSVSRTAVPEETETGCHMDPAAHEDPEAELTLDITCTLEHIGKSASVSVPLKLIK